MQCSPNLDPSPFSRKEHFRGRGRFTQGHTEGRLICVPAVQRTSYLVPREASCWVAWLALGQASSLHLVARGCHGSGTLFSPPRLGDVMGSAPNRKAAPRQAPPFATATAFAAGRQALTVLGRLARVAAAASYIVCQSVRERRCPRQSQDVRDAEQQL